ncbi:MAG: TlyA family RNA methyltransferase [Dethiobacter sp.]|jgi:23S rRNA (cytidine1920-2'-O)/16S rRNA (cytidine1409-2'-O)-methyltransferase|nr:TlyA family RNA methyltransferase [Dethiobacter sp.]MBS3897197.1 TlyA family RNA methyltransferase [Dethiobacter sp.]MBS3983528.1 TlyA family RNA methyltransferase [Dethiobacter sp.]MCL4463573.1 TlyA family RNA methyltransferase [Bacillota bacterium]MCL5993101.1 TlyA family RNA methyltransferase [Bacillota bacterium]
MGTERKRIDVILTERGYFPSRSAARAALMAGLVSVDGRKVDKAGTLVSAEMTVTVRELPRYVSRGGLKLEKALCDFKLNVAGRIALDVGASTGGFTDCLLQHGAAKVYSVDVGYGQLDWRLRQDERVISLERTNIRQLLPDQITAQPEFATVDVSFISLKHVLPVLKRLNVPEAVVLVKPQFEVGKGRVGKKGVVRDPQDHLEVLANVMAAAAKEGYQLGGMTFSPIKGPEGNIEYLIYLTTSGPAVPADFTAVVATAHEWLVEKGNRPAADE